MFVELARFEYFGPQAAELAVVVRVAVLRRLLRLLCLPLGLIRLLCLPLLLSSEIGIVVVCSIHGIGSVVVVGCQIIIIIGILRKTVYSSKFCY